jgi:hypothetical protein
MAVAAAERPRAGGERTGLTANATGFVDALFIGVAIDHPCASLQDVKVIEG